MADPKKGPVDRTFTTEEVKKIYLFGWEGTLSKNIVAAASTATAHYSKEEQESELLEKVKEAYYTQEGIRGGQALIAHALNSDDGRYSLAQAIAELKKPPTYGNYKPTAEERRRDIDGRNRAIAFIEENASKVFYNETDPIISLKEYLGKKGYAPTEADYALKEHINGWAPDHMRASSMVQLLAQNAQEVQKDGKGSLADVRGARKLAEDAVWDYAAPAEIAENNIRRDEKLCPPLVGLHKDSLAIISKELSTIKAAEKAHELARRDAIERAELKPGDSLNPQVMLAMQKLAEQQGHGHGVTIKAPHPGFRMPD